MLSMFEPVLMFVPTTPEPLTFIGGLWLGAKAFSVGMIMFVGVRVWTTIASD